MPHSTFPTPHHSLSFPGSGEILSESTWSWSFTFLQQYSRADLRESFSLSRFTILDFSSAIYDHLGIFPSFGPSRVHLQFAQSTLSSLFSLSPQKQGSLRHLQFWPLFFIFITLILPAPARWGHTKQTFLSCDQAKKLFITQLPWIMQVLKNLRHLK